LILTDSLSSVKALWCSEKYRIGIIRWFTNVRRCSDLLENGVEVEIMWIPAHERLEGNETVDERARHAALTGAVFEIPLPPMLFQGMTISVFLKEWQGKWDAAHW
jgi:hypothetical protein